MKYICAECTGRTDEEHTFHLDEEPEACPYNGCSKVHIKPIETYLRKQLQDARWDVQHYKEKARELREKENE